MSAFESPEHEQRHLHLLEKQKIGQISDLMLYPKLKLSEAGIKYTPKFSYTDAAGQSVFEDFYDKHDRIYQRTINKLWRFYGYGKLQMMRWKGQWKVVHYEITQDEAGDVDGNR